MPGFEWFGEEERTQVNDVLDNGVLFRYGFDAARKGHWKALTFERELAQRLGVAHCHLCSSGTAALSTALAACGIGAGDEVIIPPFTFVATFEALVAAGAVPVFAEIDETLGLDPRSVEARLTPRTKGVMVVHMCGAMARIDELKALCDRKGLMLIEDTCQSIGGSYKGKALGTFGQAGCFSFDPVKTITCGEAGAAVTDDAQRYAIMHAFADHGHDHIGNDRGAEDHPIIGYNYRVSELNAAVGIAQLRKLDRILETQRRNKAALKSVLARLPNIQTRQLPDESGDSATFLSFLLPDEALARAAAQKLNAGGVDGCFYYYDNNWHYLRRWHHFKQLKAAAPVPVQLVAHLPDYAAVPVPRSDAIIARNISMQIKLSWTPAELETRMARMHHILQTI
jgi:8-amino-3,8-dideoxy-alpha-D-manno-octulosonate transaminase